MSAGLAQPLRQPLGHELARLVARARDLTPRRWAAPAPPFASRADAAFHLAAGLAAASGAPVPLPRLDSPMVLPDQLAVVGYDLLTATVSETVLAEALAELLLHRRDIDGAAPGRGVAALVLAILAPGIPAERFPDVARFRCPAG